MTIVAENANLFPAQSHGGKMQLFGVMYNLGWEGRKSLAILLLWAYALAIFATYLFLTAFRRWRKDRKESKPAIAPGEEIDDSPET